MINLYISPTPTRKKQFYKRNRIEMNSSPEINNLQCLLSRCQNDIPRQMLDAQYYIRIALAEFYGIQGRWTMQDLNDALRHSTRFERNLPNDYNVVVKLVYDDELSLIGMDPDMLSIRERSRSSRGWYIPFPSQRVFDRFESDISKLRGVVRVIYE